MHTYLSQSSRTQGVMKCFSAISAVDPHLFQNNRTDSAAQGLFCFEDFPDWCHSCFCCCCCFISLLNYDHSEVLKSVVSLNVVFEKKKKTPQVFIDCMTQGNRNPQFFLTAGALFLISLFLVRFNWDQIATFFLNW